MNATLEIVRTLPEHQWRAFVDAHPKGNVFHTPEMFQVFQQTRGYEPELWAALGGGEILALFLPVHTSLHSGPLRPLLTRTVVYGSVLSAPGERGTRALMELLAAYKASASGHSLFTELRNLHPLAELCAPLEAQGFHYEEHLNYLIDLDRPEEAVFQAIGKRTRRNIKNGLNKGLVAIEEVQDPSGVAACYRLLDATYHAAHVPLSDASLFEAAFRILGPKGMVRFTLARIAGQNAAVSIELPYKDVLYGWYGGMDRRWTSCVPNELLMWDILKWGARNGFKVYDFGGAGKPDEEYGVRVFKAKFGGELVCYGRNTWAPSPQLLSVISGAYGVLRRVLY